MYLPAYCVGVIIVTDMSPHYNIAPVVKIYRQNWHMRMRSSAAPAQWCLPACYLLARCLILFYDSRLCASTRNKLQCNDPTSAMSLHWQSVVLSPGSRGLIFPLCVCVCSVQVRRPCPARRVVALYCQLSVEMFLLTVCERWQWVIQQLRRLHDALDVLHAICCSIDFIASLTHQQCGRLQSSSASYKWQ